MYEQFFRLECRPFAATPDPACFFHTEHLSAILEQIRIGIEDGQGISILTAPAGMGKTLICQRLAEELSGQFRTVLLSNSNFSTRSALLQAILFETGVEVSRKDEQELRHELRRWLDDIRSDHEALVLIVDEAHQFDVELLEEIRILTDLADNGRSLVRVVLAGQLELEERMIDRQFDAINQRISKHAYIEPLSISESVEFVRHRIEWAGRNPDEVFSAQGVRIVARASCGVPRCLNQLADHSLLLSFAAEETPVSEATVREALEDLKQLPLHWNDVNDADRILAATAESVVDDGREDEPENDACASDEGNQPVDSAVAGTDGPPQECPPASRSESSAQSAVFEFGADETVDECDAVDTSDEYVDSTGHPSLPVAEISGVVVDLSSDVCGVVEVNAGPDESGGRPESDVFETTQNQTPDCCEVQAADSQQSQDDSGLTDRDRTSKDDPGRSGESPTAVFEFGTPAVEPESNDKTVNSESGVCPADAEPLSMVTVPADGLAEKVFQEEHVLEEIEAARRESVEFRDDPEPVPGIKDADPVVVFETETEQILWTPDADGHRFSTEGQSRQKPYTSDALDAGMQNRPVSNFEAVSDPYSVIQEPLGAGIVWDVPSRSEESDPAEIQTADAELTLEHDAQGRVEVGSQEPSPESQRLTREIDFGTSSEPVPEVSRELTAPGGPGVESTPGKSDAEWVREEDDSLLTPGQAASVPSSETDEQESRDIDGPGMETLPSREVHPDRYIEAIVPMLSEINDEFHVDVHPSDSPERRAVDIERELVETMTQEDADVEDQIGATVLEICLDAQWGLHQDHRDASGVSSEEPESTPFTGESEEFDTVQPEESAVLEEGFMDEVSQISRMESNASSQSEIRCSEVQRPFERLFSELRRRASHG